MTPTDPPDSGASGPADPGTPGPADPGSPGPPEDSSSGEADPERAESDTRRPAVARLVVLAAVVAGGLALYHLTPLGGHLTRDGIRQALDGLRGNPWAPVIFVLTYAAASALAIPGTVLTLAGGALFGTLWGTVYNTLGANIGANLAFLEARWLGREGVRRLAGDRLEKLDRATRDHGFRGLLALRLVPVVPFNALNFGSGLTAISWRVYALATAVGILPGTVVYTMFADALLEGSTEASREALIRVAVSGALLLLLSFLPSILRRLHVRIPGAGLLVLATAASTVGWAQQAPPLTRILQEIPDHAAFTRVIEDVVDEPRVDYRALDARSEALDAYVDELAATDPDLLSAAPESVRLAFWINAYNACMLRRVVEHYPLRPSGSLLTRLRNVVAGRPANSVWQIDGVFTRPHCRVAGSERSQDEIEHEIIRPMGDPRIHFAVNCAARSCPSLVAEAYRPAVLESQLDAAVHRFLEDPRHFQVDRREGVVRLNRVLDWYGEDFGGEEGILRFLAGYLPEDVASILLAPETEVRYVEYDWTLNDVER